MYNLSVFLIRDKDIENIITISIKIANKLNTIKDRVLQVAKLRGITYEIFCENIGMSYGSFKGSAKKRPLNSDAIDNILSIYTDINAEWLITGKGDILKNPALSPQPEGVPDINIEEKNISPHEIELMAENKYLKKRIEDLEIEKERMLKELDLKNELIKLFYEGRITHIPSEIKTESKGRA